MKMLTFKVTEDEDRAIRVQARHAKLTVSELLRRKLRAEAMPRADVQVGRSKSTGAPVFIGTADMPVLSVDSVRELLADFP